MDGICHRQDTSVEMWEVHFVLIAFVAGAGTARDNTSSEASVAQSAQSTAFCQGNATSFSSPLIIILVEFAGSH